MPELPQLPRLANTTLPMCDAAFVQDLLEKIQQLDAFWLPRHPHLPYFTLGANNTYDLTANPAQTYWRRARQYNPFLLTHFAALYALLLNTLRQYLRQEVEFLPGVAMPGFNIFCGDPGFDLRRHAGYDIMLESWFLVRDRASFPGNPIHTDTVYRSLGLEAQQRLSFTLPLALPAAGAGLKIWPLTQEHTEGMSLEQQLSLIKNTQAEEIPYQTGQLFVQSGDYYHQARGLPLAEQDWRITLQGHAVLQNGRWLLFW